MKSLYESILDVDANINQANTTAEDMVRFTNEFREGLTNMMGNGPIRIQNVPRFKRELPYRELMYSYPVAIDCTDLSSLRIETTVRRRVKAMAGTFSGIDYSLTPGKETRISGEIYYRFEMGVKLKSYPERCWIKFFTYIVRKDDGNAIASIVVNVPEFMADMLYPESEGFERWVDTAQAAGRNLIVGEMKK